MGSMKLSAQAASAPDGGALMVARLAASSSRAHAGKVEFHACGHSAGAIFHSFFVPPLVEAGGALTSLHLLAPAVNVPTFKARLMPLSGHGIGATTMFTMHREFERADTAGPYPKSLLYLVHHSFEDLTKTAILGLEENVAADAEVGQFFRQPSNEIGSR